MIYSIEDHVSFIFSLGVNMRLSLSQKALSASIFFFAISVYAQQSLQSYSDISGDSGSEKCSLDLSYRDKIQAAYNDNKLIDVGSGYTLANFRNNSPFELNEDDNNNCKGRGRNPGLMYFKTDDLLSFIGNSAEEAAAESSDALSFCPYCEPPILPQEPVLQSITDKIFDTLFQPLFSQETPVRVSSTQGLRNHPIYGIQMHTPGVDYAVPAGTKVHSPVSGRVVYTHDDCPSTTQVGCGSGYGNHLRLELYDGSFMFLSHCKPYSNLNKGKMIAAGEAVCQADASGTATGPHVDLRLSQPMRDDNLRERCSYQPDGEIFRLNSKESDCWQVIDPDAFLRYT